MTHRRTIAIDFDGVISDYSKGFIAADKFGDILPGAKESIDKLHNDGWYIIINTCRDRLDAVKKFLNDNKVYFDKINENADFAPKDVSPKKILADVYLDDRGVRFTDWEQALSDVNKYGKKASKKNADWGMQIPDVRQEEEMDDEKIIDNVVKTSMYHVDIGNIHRPTIYELNEKLFLCPKCKQPMKLRIKKPITNSIYDCECGTFIPYQNILHTQDLIDEHKESKLI